MRVTNNILINNMMRYISSNLNRMDKYQQQLATGMKISVPSDDPVVAARALKLRTDVSQVEQYRRNVNDAESWIDITESTLNNIQDVLHRARELAVQGNNGTMTETDRIKIAEEIKQLKNQLINLANTTYAGRQIFSGYKTDTKLLNDDGTFAIDVLNTERIEYEIGIGDSININVCGGDLFNYGNDAQVNNKAKMIEVFDKFIEALELGENIGESITDLDEAMDNLLRVRADLGARANRLELTANRLDSDVINFTMLMSQNENVDMAETIMKLKNEENVYRASLAGGARIIMPTLVDFIR